MRCWLVGQGAEARLDVLRRLLFVEPQVGDVDLPDFVGDAQLGERQRRTLAREQAQVEAVGRVLDQQLDHAQCLRTGELLEVVEHQAHLRAEARERVRQGDDEGLGGIVAAVVLERLEGAAGNAALAQRLGHVADQAREFVVVAIQCQPRDAPTLFHEIESPGAGKAGLAIPRRADDQHQLALTRAAQAFEQPRSQHEFRTQARRRDLGLDQVHRQVSRALRGMAPRLAVVEGDHKRGLLLHGTRADPPNARGLRGAAAP